MKRIKEFSSMMLSRDGRISAHSKLLKPLSVSRVWNVHGACLLAVPLLFFLHRDISSKAGKLWMLVPLSMSTLRQPSAKITGQVLQRLLLCLHTLLLWNVEASATPVTSSRFRLAVLLFRRLFLSSRLLTFQWMLTPITNGCVTRLPSLRVYTSPWTSASRVTPGPPWHLWRLCRSGARFVRWPGTTAQSWTAGDFMLPFTIGPAHVALWVFPSSSWWCHSILVQGPWVLRVACVCWQWWNKIVVFTIFSIHTISVVLISGCFTEQHYCLHFIVQQHKEFIRKINKRDTYVDS